MNRPCRPALACLVLAATLAAGRVQAQGGPAPSRSGDAWVDARLLDIGSYAATYRDAFVDELVRYHRAPRDLVLELMARPGWTPGDVYLACSLAMQAGRPCRDVAELRQRDGSADWARVAEALGLEPGTPAFLPVKRGIVAAYDRWARPVAVDDDMAPLFPNRPRARPAASPDTRPAKGGHDRP